MQDTLRKCLFMRLPLTTYKRMTYMVSAWQESKDNGRSGRHFFATGTVPNHWTRHGDGRPRTGSARLLRLSKDRPTSPACSYWWHGSTRGGSRFRLTQTKTDRLGSSPCRNMKRGWQDPLLFCLPQICFRSSTKSASKLGMAQTTPDREKTRNGSAGMPLRVDMFVTPIGTIAKMNDS